MLVKTRLQRRRVGALIASCLLLASCAYLYPDADPQPERDDKELHFDAPYYSQNAKEYFEGGHYAKAKQQLCHARSGQYT